MKFSELENARALLAKAAFHTPLAPSPHLGNLVGSEVWLKLENLQRTGSFKIRGAFAKMARLSQVKPGAAVVAASAGNHAQGVAVSARMLGMQATIFMPNGVSLSKQQATEGAGAAVRLVGDSVEDGLEAARAMTGAEFIHPFDDEEIIAGQGSVGLEILEDLPGVEAVVVPLGGGGLLAGVAAAIKAKAPGVKVIGVEPAAAPSAGAALAAGRPILVAPGETLADGARLAKVGEITFPIIRDMVDRVVQVDEEHISQAMLMLIERRRVVSEGAGALPLAALMAGELPELVGKRVVLLVSGGNLDSNLLVRIIDQGLVRAGRIYRFWVDLDDRPGCLADLLGAVAKSKANVLHILHDRLARNLPAGRSAVYLELETRGSEHSREVGEALRRRGFELRED